MNAVPLTPASKDAPSIEALAAELAAAREQIAEFDNLIWPHRDPQNWPHLGGQ
jgi:hypothetical protein